MKNESSLHRRRRACDVKPAVAELDDAWLKERAKKESGTDVPAGFGKPQENAEQFKDVGFTLKKKTPAAAPA